ncbi:glycoside hydrolase family 36 protein [Luteimonas sp. FCS-9]|uniref:glycoside hydrolase family 36 protein n=1 Tax=Luteimonas sp. FCS-9 TaxID=1547516 RepID=UPI00063E968E|nr:glycoside hydrolase family 36 protein [Luteimonas sp. FCS-9]KLJ01937.1 glycoside hydrolase [Luteimonas sp. FCS-9]
MLPVRRRTVLKLVSGSAMYAALPLAHAAGPATKGAVRAVADDSLLSIEFDAALRTRLSSRGEAITGFDASEALLLADGGVVDDFAFEDARIARVADPRHGPGRRHTLRGRSPGGIEKTVELTFHERHPGMAVLAVQYRNDGDAPLEVAGWRNAAHVLAERGDGFWSFSGATHTDRRDWVQPMGADFAQRNTLAMDSSDYGGGTPVADVWRRDVGLAVGHLETRPRLLDLPVARTPGGAAIAVESRRATTLAPGATLRSDRTFVCVHTGDYYAALLHYARWMADAGIAAPEVPASAFAPIWCAWGYERDFTTEQVLGTLPKVKELGFEWVVLDDGWQTNEGDWQIDTRKFPRGEDDMRAFVQAIRAQGLRPRLWLAPLAADPGSEVLYRHTDMLLLDEDGASQNVTWWNAFTQCPGYQPTVDFYVALVTKIIGDWGFEGLKLDGQHLNAVAPCYNPTHNHADPMESCEAVATFWQAIYDAAHAANPDAIVELCPCGTAFAFHNLPATDQYPSSDPLSSWQVRHKGKTIKALIGRRGSYAGDHVELADGGADFASSVGIGAVISTKFTWPADIPEPKLDMPPGGLVLGPEKEALWRKWIDLYREHMLPKGDYLGTLYDIGFDKPETHVIGKDGALYYAFYADRWDGPLQLRGLGRGRWRVRDLFGGADLGIVDGRQATVAAAFETFLLLQAVPEGRDA